MHPLFSPLHSSAHCPTQPPPPCIPTSFGSHTLSYQNPSLPDIDLSIVAPTTLSTRLEGKRKGGQLTKSIEQVDHHRANGLASPHEKS